MFPRGTASKGCLREFSADFSAPSNLPISLLQNLAFPLFDLARDRLHGACLRAASGRLTAFSNNH
jgi:hypothetical protein